MRTVLLVVGAAEAGRSTAALHRATDAGAIRAYEKAGFRHVGRLRQGGYWLGQVCDEVIMDAWAAEFEGPSVITAGVRSGGDRPSRG